jgi:hypothetical protein
MLPITATKPMIGSCIKDKVLNEFDDFEDAWDYWEENY